MIQANGHSTEADTSLEATEEEALEMRIDIRFPPRAWIEELMLGDLDVVAMANRQLQTPADAALASERPAEVFKQVIQRTEQLRIIDFVRRDDDGSLYARVLNRRQYR